MRSTVGPLPPAVYWRRRAVVLGAVLLGIIVLFVSCSGGDDSNSKRGQGTSSSQLPTPAPAKSTPDTTTSFLTAAPGGPNLPQPGDVTTAPTDSGTGTGTGTNGNVNAPTGDTCTDAEMALTPLPASTSVKSGSSLKIHLTIKNVGTRTCTRDLGAGAQEVYIDQGAQKVWSSDTCSNSNGSDVQTMAPGATRQYDVTWNGHTATQCQGDQAAGPLPAAGAYQLRSRLSTELSNPVTVAITS
jgi:hypothetical protein